LLKELIKKIRNEVKKMNRVDLIGRLVRETDVRYSQGQKPMAIASFSLAVDRKFKQEGQPTADFINCKAFGKTAEVIEKYVTKGTKIAVCGHIQTGSYTNKDGQKVYTTDVIVDELEFCESKSSQNTQNAPQTNVANADFMQVDENMDGLPFQ
jgi:single-strand DNA-binding protein